MDDCRLTRTTQQNMVRTRVDCSLPDKRTQPCTNRVDMLEWCNGDGWGSNNGNYNDCRYKRPPRTIDLDENGWPEVVLWLMVALANRKMAITTVGDKRCCWKFVASLRQTWQWNAVRRCQKMLLAMMAIDWMSRSDWHWHWLAEKRGWCVWPHSSFAQAETFWYFSGDDQSQRWRVSTKKFIWPDSFAQAVTFCYFSGDDEPGQCRRPSGKAVNVHLIHRFTNSCSELNEIKMIKTLLTMQEKSLKLDYFNRTNFRVNDYNRKLYHNWFTNWTKYYLIIFI